MWLILHIVGIDLKNGGGGQVPKCLHFAQGMKFMADFHSKMSVCRHELGVGGSTPHPTPTIPTLILQDAIAFLPYAYRTRTLFRKGTYGRPLRCVDSAC